MKNKFLFLIVLGLLVSASLLLSAAFAQSKPIDIKYLYLGEGTETLKTVDKANGNPISTNTIKVEKTKLEGKEYLYREDKGEGITGKDKTFKSWETQSWSLLEGNRLIPYSVKFVQKNKDGQVVYTIEKTYNFKDKKIYCKINGKSKEFTCYPDQVDKEQLGLTMGNYPFEAKEKKDISLHLFTHEPSMYKINAKFLGEEKVAIGKRTYDCYKLEMQVDLGALNIIGAFIPKTYFWFQTKKPYDFVKYEGLESGLNTPYVIMIKTEKGQ